MNAPSSRLQSRPWRWRNSIWLLGPFLSFGFFTVFSFLWLSRAVRDPALRKLSLLIYAPATALLWLSLALTPTGPEENAFSNIGPLTCIVMWIGGTIHAVRLNRKLLAHRAASGTGGKWYEQPQSRQAAQQPTTSPTTPSGAWQNTLGVHDVHNQAWGAPAPHMTYPQSGQAAAKYSASPVQAAQEATSTWADPHTSSPPTALVEVNLADESALRQLPGVGPAAAKRIIAHRQTHGRLGGLTDLAAAGIPPHVLAGLQDKVSFQAGTPVEQTRRGGRVLDI